MQLPTPLAEFSEKSISELPRVTLATLEPWTHFLFIHRARVEERWLGHVWWVLVEVTITVQEFI